MLHSLSRKKFQSGRKIQLKSVDKKTGTQMQQTAAMRFSSSILAFIEKSDLHFSKFYNFRAEYARLRVCSNDINKSK